MTRKIGFVSILAGLALSCVALADSDAEILERIKPIGRVNVDKPVEPAPAPVAEAAPAAAPVAEAASAPAPTAEAPAAAPVVAAAAVDGASTYNTFCMACHMTGAANAPKFADKEAWAPRIAKGMDALMQSAINGIPGTAMPPRGTCATCSDAALKAAIAHMVATAQ